MSSEWMRRRLAGITGTDIAAILGYHPYKNALDVWAEKTGRIKPKDLSDREDVHWGNVLEPVVLGEMARRTGREIISPDKAEGIQADYLALDHEGELKFMFSRPDRPRLLCTPDAITTAWKPLPWSEGAMKERTGLGLVEAKTTNAYGLKAWEDGAPLYHQIQAGYNAAVMGLSWNTVTGLVGGQTLLTYDYGLSEERGAWLLNRAQAFWDAHVETDLEPRITRASEIETWRALHPDDNGITVTLDPASWQARDRFLQNLKAQAKTIKKEIADIEAEIKGILGDCTYAEIPGAATYSLKTQERGEHVVKASKFRVLRRRSSK